MRSNWSKLACLKIRGRLSGFHFRVVFIAVTFCEAVYFERKELALYLGAYFLYKLGVPFVGHRQTVQT